MKRRRLVIFGILLMVLSSCNKNPRSTVWEDDLSVYFLDKKETSVVDEGYTPKHTSGIQVVSELLSYMRNPLDEQHVAAIPETVSSPEVIMGVNGLVTLQFDESYSTVTGVREVLMRAAIVKTLCQMEEIDSVEIYVAGQPLMGALNTPIGIMKADDFIDNMGPQTGEYQYLHAKVYYANKEGNALLASDLKIPYSGSETEEQTVLRQLIAGPIEEEMYPVLSDRVKVLSVSTKDGVCSVNLNDKFLDKLPDVTEEITIYSVVNTLAELPGIYQVQFLVDGEQVKGYQTMDLTLLYERNLNVIEKE